ncbi:MAG: cytidine deaminase [Vicinamibacterales bacterium]
MADSKRGDAGWKERRGRKDRRTHAERRKPARRARGKTTERRKAERRKGAERRDENAWKPMPLDTLAADVAEDQELLAAAADARELARASYSQFKVGAALETIDGTIVTGCNIENASYGLTLCAERVALVKALSEGHTAFTRILVIADTADPTPPCGACRQLLWEYCGDIDVLLANLQGVAAELRLSALLPMPFDERLL